MSRVCRIVRIIGPPSFSRILCAEIIGPRRSTAQAAALRHLPALLFRVRANDDHVGKSWPVGGVECAQEQERRADRRALGRLERARHERGGGHRTTCRLGTAQGIEDATIHLIGALLITQFVGFPAALLFGRLGDRIGARAAIGVALAVYAVAVVWAARMTESWEFYGLAVMIGLVQGGVQAMSRALFARLIPREHAGRLFGLYNMMGKFAAGGY